MAIQHKDIPDANRHEPKGASTASSGQVARANGDGTTTFVNPSTLSNVLATTELTGIDTSTQAPAAVDTPITVTFGSSSSGTNVSLSSGGVVTFNTAGFYDIEAILNIQRTAAAGVAKLVARVLVNGTATDPTYTVSLADLADGVPLRINLKRSFSATNTLSIQFMRDSSGINNGSLVPLDPVLVGWNNVPSAYIKVMKLTGVA